MPLCRAQPSVLLVTVVPVCRRTRTIGVLLNVLFIACAAYAPRFLRALRTAYSVVRAWIVDPFRPLRASRPSYSSVARARVASHAFWFDLLSLRAVARGARAAHFV